MDTKTPSAQLLKYPDKRRQELQPVQEETTHYAKIFRT